jgi:hypothetical protein
MQAFDQKKHWQSQCHPCANQGNNQQCLHLATVALPVPRLTPMSAGKGKFHESVEIRGAFWGNPPTPPLGILCFRDNYINCLNNTPFVF